MKKMILGYATHHGLEAMTAADARRLTHVNLAFGTMREGLLDMRGLPGLREQLSRLRGYNPALRFVLSIGGWGAGGFSLMARTERGCRAFAASVGEAMEAYALDGADIDWEYPCSNAAGIDCDPSDRENFTLLLQALRDAVGERILSIAAGSGAYFIRDTEMEKVAAILDYVQIMTYDLRTGRPVTGHHTPLYPGEMGAGEVNARDCVSMFVRAGVPREKLIIGAAFYSRVWKKVKNTGTGLGQPAAGPAGFGPGYDELQAAYIDQNGFRRHWDAQACAPYLFNGDTFISYDDCESVAAKCRFVLREGLRGLMYWEHSCDKTGTLLKTIAETFAEK